MMATNFEIIPDLPPESPVREPAPALAGGAFLRLPGVSVLDSLIPRDGRFPRWAYVAFPVVALLFAISITLLAMRSSPPPVIDEGSTAALAAPAESGTPGEAREVAVEVGGLDAAGWRIGLRNAARAKEWPKVADAVVALLKLDPSALRDRDAQASVRNAAFALAQEGGEASDKFFDALTNDSGSEGLDALYDIARFRQGTKAGKRATEILRRPEVMARASAPLEDPRRFSRGILLGQARSLWQNGRARRRSSTPRAANASRCGMLASPRSLLFQGKQGARYSHALPPSPSRGGARCVCVGPLTPLFATGVSGLVAL